MNSKDAVNVLIIDEDEINNFILEKLIKKVLAKVNITICENGALAMDHLLTTIKKDRAYPDFIFVDITMPVMNGWTFLEEYLHYDLNKIFYAKIFIATSSVFKQDRDRAFRFPIVEGFITKPFSLEVLRDVFDISPRLV